MQTKVRIYAAIVRSTLLYGAETWTLKVADKRKLDVFDRGKLRKIAGIHWFDKISNEKLMAMVNLPKLEAMVMRKRWKWLGHVLRMKETRWPNKMLRWTGDDIPTKRPRGAPTSNWSRQVINEGWERIKWVDYGMKKPIWSRWTKGEWLTSLTTFACDRSKWRVIVESVVS